MQSAKTGRPTIKKSFRNSGEAAACSSKQRYSIERQLECRPYLISTRFRFQHSCHAASSPQISAVGPDLRRSVRSIWPCRYLRPNYSARAPSQVPL